MWDNLIALLTELVALYRSLLTLSKQKREILIAAKAQELEALTKQEEVLILKVGKLDIARQGLIKDIAAVYGLDDSSITLLEAAGMADEATAAKLKNLAAEFDGIMRELVPINQQNTKLIQQALHFINYNLNVLAQSTTGPVYAPPTGQASAQAAPRRSLFDRKI